MKVRKYYGYKMVSLHKSVELCLYEKVAIKRPHNVYYESFYHDVEQRWYLNRDRMINRLLELGFTRREIDNAPVYPY